MDSHIFLKKNKQTVENEIYQINIEIEQEKKFCLKWFTRTRV